MTELISSHLNIGAQTAQLSEREDSINILTTILETGVTLNTKQQILQYLGVSAISTTIGLSIGAAMPILGTGTILLLGISLIGYGGYLRRQP